MTIDKNAPAATDTPETDAAQAAYTNTSPVTSGGWAFARPLERERDDARHQQHILTVFAEKQKAEFEAEIAIRDSSIHDWWIAASPYATPQALKEGIARLREFAKSCAEKSNESGTRAAARLVLGEGVGAIIDEMRNAAIDAARKERGET